MPWRLLTSVIVVVAIGHGQAQRQVPPFTSGADLVVVPAKRIGPRDTLTVIRLNGHRGVTSSTPSVLLKAIQQFSTFGDSLRTLERDAQHALSTISDLTQQMSKVPHRRKVLVWIGSPAMFGQHQFDAISIPVYGSEWYDAIRDSGRNNVSVYIINPTRPLETDGTLEPSEGASGLASQTGGEAFVHSVNYDRAIDLIWRESGSYYLLGYAPSIDDQRLHAIDVRVKRTGVRVRARRLRG